VQVTAPPRSTDTQDDRDLAQRVADLEALIEEARRRARRRRRFYAAAVLAAAAAVAGALFGVGGKGHGSVGGNVAEGAPAAAAAQGGRGQWSSLGPDGGALTLAVDPANANVVYAGGWGVVFKSADGGGSWKAVTTQPWTRISALTVDPTDPRVVWAGTERGIAKTVDGGRRWRMVNGGLFNGETPYQRGHRLGEGFVWSLVVDRHDPRTVYAVTDRGLFRTSDGGTHWRIIGPPLFRKRTCESCQGRYYGYGLAAAIQPSSGTIYASWGRGDTALPRDLYKSTDHGRSWQRVAMRGSLRPSFFETLAIDHAGTLYAADRGLPGITQLRGVIKSKDGGRTWGSAGLPKQTVWQLQVDTGNGSTLYATTGGFFESNDGGATWQSVANGANAPTSAVVSDPHHPNLRYGIANNGVVKSGDGGRTWAAADTGLVSTYITSLALAPGGARVLYAGTFGRIFKSVDDGRTWRPERSRLGDRSVDALVVDPHNRSTLYAAEQGNGLFKSSDAGANWSAVATGVPALDNIALDPKHPGTLYIATCGGVCEGGILEKTNDGGTSWRPIRGIPWSVQSLAIDPRHPNTLFAGTRRGEIFRSKDGASSWHRMAKAPALPRSHQYEVVAIVIDPRDPANVYAVRRKGGISKSSDGGKTWTRANTGLTDTHINALAIDPRDPRILFASTGGSFATTPARVFRSTDGARTWHPFSAGLPAVGVTAFAIDPSGRSIFAATAGGGVIQLRRHRG
jgi:photosystem II stability/assembly factor-like uncharacterized protein